MPYKISGTKNSTARLIIVKESDWSIESNTVISGTGAYEILDLESGDKTIIADANGEIIAYGDVAAVSYTPANGDRGLFGGGSNNGTSGINTIEYITISSLGDATNFGDLTISRYYLGATSNGTTGRGVFGGGYTTYPTYVNTLDYVEVLTLSDATDFGDLLTLKTMLSATSNRTDNRGVYGGGFWGAATNILEYITISTPGNSQDFGDLTEVKYSVASCSNAENNRGLWGGGYTVTNTISYITINSTGNATNFGDLIQARARLAATSDGVSDRGVFAGGAVPAYVDTIDYVTISTTSDATDFGNLTTSRSIISATSNSTGDRGVFGGGASSNIIDYITISTTGNALDFGDLSTALDGVAATSNG